MDNALVDVFEQARQVVADADRKVAEEEQRRRESEREVLLAQLGERIEEAFDFTSKEKLELEPRLDVQDGIAVVEFVVRSLRAIFLLTPGEGNTWTLRVIEDDRGPQVLSEFRGWNEGRTRVTTSGIGTHRHGGRQLGPEHQGTRRCSEHESSTAAAETAPPKRA